MKSYKMLSSAIVLSLAASVAMAERVTVASNAGVQQSVKRLTKAVEQAGAKVFTTVDFAKGAASVGEELRPTTVVIFGNPKIGAVAVTQSQTMALYLPLRILFFEDAGGQTWATYDEPGAIAPTHGLDKNNPAIVRMQTALEKFTDIATGN